MTPQDVATVNRELYNKDDSHLWPISNKFNATARAILRVARARRAGLVIDDVLSYKAAVETEISEIVNNNDNW